MSPALEPSLAWGGYGTSPIRATVSRHQTARPGSLTTPPPLVSSKPTRTGASGLRLRVSTRSTQPGAVQPLHQAEEHPLPRVPGQEAIDVRPAVRTIWHGTWINATQNVLNSIRSSDRFSARCLSTHRGCSGTSSAAHAFRLQAKDAITM